MIGERKKTKESLEHGKPGVYGALQRSGLTQREVWQRAGVGKETFRRALYGHVGARSARAIAGVLGEGLSEIRALEEELRQPPRENP